MPNPTLAGKVTLDDSQAEATLRRFAKAAATAMGTVDSKLATAGKSFESFAGRAGPALAAAAAAAAAAAGVTLDRIAKGINGVYENGRALEQLSRQTGAGVAGLVVLQAKFEQAGLGSDAVGRSIARLQKSIAGLDDAEVKGGAAQIARLGLNLDALKKLSPDRQLLSVGAALAQITDPAQRAADAMGIFGRGGAELLGVFNGDFGRLSPHLAQQAQVLARNAALFEQVSIRLGRAGAIFETFYLGAADGLSRALIPVLDRLEKINLIGVGEKFGAAMAQAADKMVPFLDELQRADLVGTATRFSAAMISGASAFTDAIGELKKVTDGVIAAFATPAPAPATEEDGTPAKRSLDPFQNVANAFTGRTTSARGAGEGNAPAANDDGSGEGGGLIHGLLESAGYTGGRKAKADDDQQAAEEGKRRQNAAATAAFLAGPDPYAASNNQRPETLPSPYRRQEWMDAHPRLGASLPESRKGHDTLPAPNQRPLSAPTTPLPMDVFRRVQEGLMAVGRAFDPTFLARMTVGAARQREVAEAASGGGGGANASTAAPVTVTARDMRSDVRMAAAQSGMSTRGMSDADVDKLGPSLTFDTHQPIGNGRFNATDDYTARVDRMTRMGQAAAHTIGQGGALDFDPSQRPGWTGARDAFAGFRAADPNDPNEVARAARERGNYFGTSGGVFANNTGLTSGGLGGGAYGATGNIWHQLSGYGPGGQKKEDKNGPAAIVSKLDQLITIHRETWGAGGSGSGSSAGATATGK